MDVVVDPRTFDQSKIPPTVIAKVAEMMRRDPKLESPSAKKRWPHTVYINGQKIVVMCHEEFGKIGDNKYALRPKTES